MQDFYRFAFMEDGYPGRAEPDGSIYAHPIYGTYVLSDYVKQFEQDPSEDMAAAIRTVARAALARMDEYRGASVFWYDAAPRQSARLYERHYSGLTQGYYAVELCRAAVALDEPSLADAAARVFDSLLIPADDGGVYYDGHHGPTVAEVPQRPNSWILNGWQSSLTSIHRYGELSGSEQAAALFQASAETMVRLLPLYDEPDLKISRYGLTGFTYMRLRFAKQPDRVMDLRIDVPGEGETRVLAHPVSRWQTAVVPDDWEDERPRGRTARLNAVLSLASAPRPNVLRGTVVGGGDEVVVEVMRGSYDPRASSPADASWVEVGRAALGEGESALAVEIGMETVRAVAYPTNFVKKVDGLNVNIYHGVHIRRLRELAKLAHLPEMDAWADRWAGYIDEWPDMDLYRDLAMRDFATGKVTPLAEWKSSSAPVSGHGT